MAEQKQRTVLLIDFSQTGQMRRVMDSIIAPLIAAGHRVERLTLEFDTPYPFPWPFWQFLDAFPETVAQLPPKLKTLPDKLDRLEADLILIGYPVWFLSPAPAITAFLQSDQGRRLVSGRPVVTVTACRNMWVQAHQDMCSLLKRAGAHLYDHVALTDPGPAMATFISTPRWMLSGKKNAVMGLPAAGLTDIQIDQAQRFGIALNKSISYPTWPDGLAMLRGLGAVHVNVGLASSEKIAKRSFRIWGGLIRASGPPGAWTRRPVLAIYLIFLLLMIVSVVPVSLVLRSVIAKLAPERMAARIEELGQPSGS